MRMTVEEALARGLISQEQANSQLDAQRKSSRSNVGLRGNAAGAPQKKKKPPRFICSIEGDLPQEILWRACLRKWPELKASGELVAEYQGAIPGRRFSLDIAFPAIKLGIEVDGWENHGKHLKDFKRDREKDRLLLLNGWRVARFFAKEIFDDSVALTVEIEKIINVINNEKTILQTEPKADK